VQANLRCALACAGALSMLAACSGSHSAAPAPSSKPAHSSPSSGPSTAPGTSHSTTGAPSPKKVPTTPVAPPVSGNISQTVASGTLVPLPRAGLDSTVRFRKAPLTAAIVDPRRVQAQAHIPGEIAGPALSFDLQLTNRGHAAVDVSTNIAVTAQDAAGTPFPPLTSSTRPVGGMLRAGGQVSGHYVFHLPDNIKNPVTIQVTFAATAEVARFVGPLS
jgi:hypothetical protein